MAARLVKQYTIRGIPANVDLALKRRAKSTGRSFNDVAREALAVGAGVVGGEVHDDLDFMIGSMTAVVAARVDAEVQAQRRVDPELWK